MATIIGVPKESLPQEKRVAATPESIKKLTQRGLVVRVQKGAGEAAGISDEAFQAAGAELVDDAFGAGDTVFKVRPPTADEIGRLKEGAFVVSLMQPERNPGLVDALKAKKATALALEKIPRVTRAQKMDVLSSQANLSGYRAVVEAAIAYQGFFGPAAFGDIVGDDMAAHAARRLQVFFDDRQCDDFHNHQRRQAGIMTTEFGIARQAKFSRKRFCRSIGQIGQKLLDLSAVHGRDQLQQRFSDQNLGFETQQRFDAVIEIGKPAFHVEHEDQVGRMLNDEAVQALGGFQALTHAPVSAL